MRFLVVGAGAVGGYFGGRLVQHGEDVTFLVRPARKKQLEQTGLVIKSVSGDFSGPVKVITYDDPKETFDVIILSLKAYHLSDLKSSLSPYIGASTVILPLLNGYQHYEMLWKDFGKEKVLGGLCYIESTLDSEGSIIHTSKMEDIVFGEWDGSKTERVNRIYEHLSKGGFKVAVSDNVERDIWQKYIFIACMSGITTLLRAPMGPVREVPEAKNTFARLVEEITGIARKKGASLYEDAAERVMRTAESLHPSMKSSMLRDMEKGLPVEVDHFHGYLLQTAEQLGIKREDVPVLSAVYANLKVYEKMQGLDS